MTATGIELWLLDLALASEGLHKCAVHVGLVLDDDIAHVARLSADLRQRRHAVRIALRLALWQAEGPRLARARIGFSGSGKPLVASEGLDISVAHTDTQAMIAISRAGPVGVDIESVRAVRVAAQRRRQLELVGRLLASTGRNGTPGSDAAFVQAWARIEALAKATGEGVAATLTRLGVRQVGADDALIASAVATTLQSMAGSAFVVVDVALPPQVCAGHCAACAHVSGAGPLNVRQMPKACEDLIALVK